MSEDIDAVDPDYYTPLPFREDAQEEAKAEAKEKKPKHEPAGRDCRCNELQHANKMLAEIKSDPQSTFSDIQSAKHRIEIAAVRPWQYWDAYNDWKQSKAFR